MQLKEKNNLPFYQQFTIKLIMISLLAVMLIYGKTFFVTLAFAILLSILLLPLTNFLDKKCRLPMSVANFLSIIIALSIIGFLIWFLSHEIARFLNDIPSIRKHLSDHYDTVKSWIENRFNISKKQQTTMLEDAASGTSGTEMLGQSVLTITQVIFYIILIAIYSFLILHYRHMIKRFLFAVFKEEFKNDVIEVLEQSKVIVQKYMTGLVIEMAIVAAANSIALIAIGVKYAIFLGIFSAILNIIPYVGILTGILFTCLVTLTTSTNLSDIVWIIISFEIIHFIDSNFLMPVIVGSKVKINALVTIIGVVIGGTLIGLPGIFLALPTIAILKIIFDRIEDLKPWGMLMGDDAQEPGRLYKKYKRRLQKKKEKKLLESLPPDT